MVQKDYYQVLGLSRDTSEDEIRKAYRKLALKFHPDHNPHNPESEEKFKEISKAYAVLSDSEKRREYDRFGYTGFKRKYTGEDVFRGFNFEEIFREFGLGFEFERFLRRKSFCGKRGRGCGRRRPMFTDMRFFREYSKDLSHEEETNQIYELPLTASEAFYGTQKEIAVETGLSQKRYLIQIPPGIRPNTRLSLVLGEFGREEIQFIVKII